LERIGERLEGDDSAPVAEPAQIERVLAITGAHVNNARNGVRLELLNEMVNRLTSRVSRDLQTD